jgi:Lrp/AsnC family transcriptional regulator, leucine-responsive regulatory protein
MSSQAPTDDLVLDEIDKHILRILQADARSTREQIAKKLKVSKSAVHYRVKKLERSGVIEGYHAKLNATKIGKGYEAITLVRAKFSPNYHDKLGERLASLPGVWAVYFTFGESDFIILTRGVDREDLLSAIENLTKIRGIDRTTSQLVVKTIKEDTTLEI